MAVHEAVKTIKDKMKVLSKIWGGEERGEKLLRVEEFRNVYSAGQRYLVLNSFINVVPYCSPHYLNKTPTL